MNWENVKLLGGLGSLFIVLSIVPYLGFLSAIAGIVLLFIAVKRISDNYPEDKIFLNFLKGFLISLGGMVIAAFIGGIFFVPSVVSPYSTAAEIFKYIGIFTAIVLLYAATVIGAYLYRKSFTSIGKLANNEYFNWAANLIFWGSVASIILIGGIAVWIGWILLSIAFFTINVPKGTATE